MEKMNMPEFDAVIFDMDGSLVDSMWMWRAIDEEYLSRFGLEVPTTLQEEIGGKSFTETAIFFQKRFGITDDVEKIKQDWNDMAFEKYRTQVPYKKGALEFLQWCKANGKKLGVATSNSRELVDNVGKVLGYDQYFDCIMTGCEAKRGKPFPDIYLLVAKRLGVAPERCIVFEDIVQGIQAGKAAGMTVFAVEDAYSADTRDEKIRLADYYITDFTDISV